MTVSIPTEPMVYKLLIEKTELNAIAPQASLLNAPIIQNGHNGPFVSSRYSRTALPCPKTLPNGQQPRGQFSAFSKLSP